MNMKNCIVWVAIFISLSMLAQASLLRAIQKPKVAILPFMGTGVSPATLDLLADFLWQELNSSGALLLADGNALKSTLNAAGYAETRCFDLTCAQTYGKILDVEKVVLCRVTKTGNQYRLEIKTVDLAIPRETFAESAQAPQEDALFAKLGDLTGRLIGALAQPAAAATPKTQVKTVPPSAAPPPPAAPKLQILHQPVKQATTGQMIPIEAQVRPALGENQLFLIYRAVGEERFRFTPITRMVNENFHAEIPAEIVSTKGVEYYLRVIDANNNERGRFPAEEVYLRVTVVTQKITETPATPPIAQSKAKKKGGKKWLWIGVGTVAAGAGAFLASQGKGGEEQPKLQQLPGPPNHP